MAHGGYPALELLCQGYLSLDWPDDYPNVWAAIDDYVASEPIAIRLPVDVARLLDAMPTDEGLHSFVLGELGCGYFPEPDRFTMSAWLLAVRKHVLERLGGE